jgi:hypothetical protein
MYDPDAVDLDDDHNPANCPGWLGEDREGRPIPCLRCKPDLARRSVINDYAERAPSPRARAAIERDRNA